ncbi:hypothetical protein PR048_019111, partial [Dryococelus australis]
MDYIRDMSQPQSVTDVRRLLGMVNNVGKFVPNLAEITEPIRQLLNEGNAFCGKNHKSWPLKRSNTFYAASQFYFTTAQIRIFEWDQMPPRAVLEEQDAEGVCRPVVYTSRSLSASEKEHSQIEKEVLALH